MIGFGITNMLRAGSVLKKNLIENNIKRNMPEIRYYMYITAISNAN